MDERGQQRRIRRGAQHAGIDPARLIFAEQIGLLALQRLQQIDVAVEPGAEAVPLQLVAEQVREERDAAALVANDPPARQYFGGVAQIHAVGYMPRLLVAPQDEAMALPPHRVHAGTLERSQRWSDPQHVADCRCCRIHRALLAGIGTPGQ
jgi:hypothetical protein